jgi:hypothetical protein
VRSRATSRQPSKILDTLFDPRKLPGLEFLPPENEPLAVYVEANKKIAPVARPS